LNQSRETLIDHVIISKSKKCFCEDVDGRLKFKVLWKSCETMFDFNFWYHLEWCGVLFWRRSVTFFLKLFVWFEKYDWSDWKKKSTNFNPIEIWNRKWL